MIIDASIGMILDIRYSMLAKKGKLPFTIEYPESSIQHLIHNRNKMGYFNFMVKKADI